MQVELEEGVPVLGSNRRASQRLNRDVAVQSVAPFAFDRLALARRQRREEVVEGRKAVAKEMKLLAIADQKAVFGQAFRVLDGREGDVDRRRLSLSAQLAERRDQRLSRALGRIGGDEEAAPGYRGERDGHLQLRIIVAPGPLIGVGPGVVEHVLALTMAFKIASRGGDQAAACVFNRQMRQRPAGATADRARSLERMQEGVSDEGVEW